MCQLPHHLAVGSQLYIESHLTACPRVIVDTAYRRNTRPPNCRTKSSSCILMCCWLNRHRENETDIPLLTPYGEVAYPVRARHCLPTQTSSLPVPPTITCRLRAYFQLHTATRRLGEMATFWRPLIKKLACKLGRNVRRGDKLAVEDFSKQTRRNRAVR